eukprot:Rhum_TRINITY_DN15001_c4_g1::Rhum_TRINITY_DN15001_c4_g1_i1::g.133249::m.133249
MSFVVTVEFVVSFLKFRNIDLLQQGLYKVVLTARTEASAGKEGSKDTKEGVAVPLEILSNKSDGRRGVWQDQRKATYPTEGLDESAGEMWTRSFFVRYQEQVELLTESARFTVDLDLGAASQHWSDSMLLTFELFHIAKEQLEKMPAEGYHRVVEDSAGVYDAYSEKASTKIEAELQKTSPKPIFVKHNNQRCHIYFERVAADDDWLVFEAAADPKSPPTRVQKRVKVAPRSAFQKVASKVVPVKNILLPHTEFLPVTWVDWFAASCQVVLHTCPVAVEYLPPTDTVAAAAAAASKRNTYSTAATAASSVGGAQAAAVPPPASAAAYTQSCSGFLAHLERCAPRRPTAGGDGSVGGGGGASPPGAPLPSAAVDCDDDNDSAAAAATAAPLGAMTAKEQQDAASVLSAVLSYFVYAYFHTEYWLDELGGGSGGG